MSGLDTCDSAARLARDARLVAMVEEAMGSWFAWAKAEPSGKKAPARSAVLRQRMASVVIEHAVAAAVLEDALSAAGTEQAAKVRLSRHRVRLCLQRAAEAISESRGEDAVFAIRAELAKLRAEEGETP